MKRGSDVRYIRYYSEGSEARQLDWKQQQEKNKKKVPKPRSFRQQVLKVRMDPVAVCGIVAAAMLLITLAVGAVRLVISLEKQSELKDYVAELSVENEELEKEYRDGYDLNAIREAAKAHGLVPISQVPTYQLHVEKETQEAEPPTFWQKVCDYFAGLFA